MSLAVAFGLIALFFFSNAPAQAAQPQLPTLSWQQRSDWINVKTGITPAAFGDGVHDDTAAIQAALNKLSDTSFGLRVVYLPAGTYRITSTLKLSQIYGAMIIGTGQGTRITWDGASGGVMYTSNGASRTRYVGLIWDGASKAAVGIDHQSNTYYETRIRHQDEAFVNFMEAGIRVGYNQNVPTAEVMYRNCLFQNDVSGVEFLSWNDYNNDFAQCDFRDCGTGVNCIEGNISARECHFERSTVSDFFLCTQSHAIRRCTSIGSAQFVTTGFASTGGEITIEDCHVDSWTGATGAITLGLRGPDTIFDCSFTHPPSFAPPINLVNYSTYLQVATVSNNVAPSSAGIISPGLNSQIIQVPAGKRGANLSDPTQTFINTTEAVPSRIFDVKTQYGAKGDGKTDDTLAIQNAIAAARSYGSGAIVYLPPGIYDISATLNLTGSGYIFGGSGCASVIQWIGNPQANVFAVQDPQNLSMEELRILAPNTACDVQQTSSGGPSTMTYDTVFVPGSWLGTSSTLTGYIDPTVTTRGLECVGLSATSVVNLVEFDGAMNFYDSSQATILGGFTVDGALRVGGGDYPKTGFLGLLTRVSSGNPYDISISNNQDLVMTNSYTEQTTRVLNATGDGSYIGSPGHVTIQGSQVYTFDPTPITINNYEGRITYMGAQFGYYTPLGNYNFSQIGTRPENLLLFDNNFYQAFTQTANVLPSLDSGGSDTLLGNLPSSSSTRIYDNSIISDQLPGVGIVGASAMAPGAALTSPEASAMGAVSAALDDFRLLGAMDLNINYQIASPGQLVASGATAPSNSLVNGSFETPVVGTANSEYNPIGGSWVFIGNSGIQSNGSAWAAPNAPDGTQTAFLQGNPLQVSANGTGVLGSISQSVNFASTGSYAVKLQAAQHAGQIQPIQVSVDGVPVGTPITPSTNTFQGYTSSSFIINSAGWHTVTLAATVNSGNNTSLVDLVAVTPVTLPTFANSSFETPSVGAATYRYNPTGASWTFLGSSGIQSNGSGWGAAIAPDGVQTAFLHGNPSIGASQLGSISQSVTFSAPGNFAVTFQAARCFGQVQPLKVSVDGIVVGSLLTPLNSNFGWLTSAPFTIATAGAHTITLSATDSSSDLTTLVDQFSIAPVTVAVPPTATSQSITPSLNMAMSVTLTGYDSHVPALPLTYTVTTAPAHGTLTGTAPNLTYTPATGFTGSDSFVFKVNNGTQDSALATVSILVAVPTFANSSFETPSVGAAAYRYNPTGASWTFLGSSGIQSNGSGWGAAIAPDGVQTAFLHGNPSIGASQLGSISQSVTFSAPGNFAVTFQAARCFGQVQPLKVSVDGIVVGSLLTPLNSNFGWLTSAPFTIATAGAHTITLSATDSSSDLTTLVDQFSIAPVTVAVPPTATSQSITPSLNMAMSVTLTGYDSHVPALPLTYTVTTAPAHGTLTGTAPNLTYTPATGFTGSDSFVFKVNNGTQDSALATVSILVAVPTFANSSFETPSVGAAAYRYNPTGASWTFLGSSGIQSNGSGWGAAIAPDGVQTAFLNGNPNMGIGQLGSISQSVTFAAAGTFAVTFQAARRWGQVQPIQVSVDGVNVGSPITPTDNSFQSATSGSFTISAAGIHTITLTATLTTSDLSTFVDTVALTGAIANGTTTIIPGAVGSVTAGSTSKPTTISIANSGFEIPSVGKASYKYNPIGGSWIFMGNSGIQSNGSVVTAANATDGTQTAFLEGKPGTVAPGSISQSVSIATTGTYTLTFQAARRQGQIQPIKVSVDGVQVGAALTPASNSFAPLTTASFTIRTAGLHTLTLAATTSSADLTTVIDQISVTAAKTN